MKKKVFGKQLSRDTNERKALFKGLIHALVMRESIKTTEAKAKAIKGQVEKLITKAKRKSSASKSLLQPWLQQESLEKVVNDLAVRFAKRSGGYTRILKLGERFGDNAKMAVIEFVEKPAVAEVTEKSTEAQKKPAVTKTRNPDRTQNKASARSVDSSVRSMSPKRPPSKAEMEKRKAGKGSPKKEAK